MLTFKKSGDNDDRLASDLAVVYRAPQMSATDEAEQRRRIVEFATALDRVAAHDGGRAAGLVAAGTGMKKGLWQRLRAVVSITAVIITITASISIVAHNLWGDRVPITVQVVVPALQVQNHVDHATNITHTSHAARAFPTPYPVHAAVAITHTFGAANGFGDIQGASIESADQVASRPLAGYLIKLNTSYLAPDGSLISASTAIIPTPHTLTFSYGCNDYSSANAEATLKVVGDLTRTLYTTNVYQGLAPKVAHVDVTGVGTVQWHTMAGQGQCNVIVANPSLR